MKQINFFDLHCDTATACYNQQKGSAGLVKNEWQVDFERGNKIGKWVETFACFLDDSLRGQAAFDAFMNIRALIFDAVKGNPDKACLYKTATQAVDNVCNIILSVEGGCALAGELSNVQRLKEAGVAFLTLVWNGDNEIASGVGGSGGGLTEFGREAVSELERQRIIVDISHLNEKGAEDVFNIAKKPVMATHSNACSCCEIPRNLKDWQLKYLIENKGLCGLNLFPLFINLKEDYEPEALRRHIDHILSLGGEDILAMGTDFDGAAMPSFVKDISGVSALYEHMAKWYNEKTADKIFFENAKRFVDDNLNLTASL